MIHWPTYGRVVGAVARRSLLFPQERPLLAALLLGYPAWQGLVRSARLLDHVTAPGQRSQPVRAPVFVVGHPRSGTTFLHRLLALDSRFTAPLAWQLVLPSVSLYRTVRLTRGLTPVRALADRLQDLLFDDVNVVHEVGWSLPEEDDWLFLHAAASPTLEYLSGRPDASARWWLGDELPDDTRERALRWYHRSLQRHLHATGGSATLLSKNPHFTGWMRSLLRRYPDARFVMLVRDPAEAIASRLDMVVRSWQRTAPQLPRSDPRVRPVFEASCTLYRHAEQVWEELPAAQRCRVRYDELVRDPVTQVQSLYDHMGWPFDPVRADVEAAADQARRRVPARPHKLRHFGIRDEELVDELGELPSLWASLGRQPPRRRR